MPEKFPGDPDRWILQQIETYQIRKAVLQHVPGKKLSDGILFVIEEKGPVDMEMLAHALADLGDPVAVKKAAWDLIAQQILLLNSELDVTFNFVSDRKLESDAAK